MSMEINGAANQQRSGVSTIKVNQHDKEVYASIYNMLKNGDADKNENFLLDAKDFKDEALLDFAKSKGLVGRTWDAALKYVKGVINTKNESVIEIKKDAYNEKSGEYYDSAIQNGREVSRTYYKTDADGNKVIDEIINLEYDSNGKIFRKIYLDADGNVKDVSHVSPDDETKVISRIQYNKDGLWEKQGFYDANGTLYKVSAITREKDMLGQTRETLETYVKNGDNWEAVSSDGIDAKLLSQEP